MAIWYIFPCFGILHQGKSGSPDYLKTIQMLFDTQAIFALAAVHRCGTMTEKRNVRFGAERNSREQIFQFFWQNNFCDHF
jgi:hypothetical protein